VIHDFVWKSDGTPGRGVFAQEAAEVAPFAVSVGTDDRDAGGNLTRPWGVDYSKYVPDLIVGWQEHENEMAALRGQVAFLSGAVTALRNAPRPSLYQRIREALAVWFPAWVTP
jgi:hypothetical protein